MSKYFTLMVEALFSSLRRELKRFVSGRHTAPIAYNQYIEQGTFRFLYMEI